MAPAARFVGFASVGRSRQSILLFGIGEYAALSYPVKGTGRPGARAFGIVLGSLPFGRSLSELWANRLPHLKLRDVGPCSFKETDQGLAGAMAAAASAQPAVVSPINMLVHSLPL